MLFIYRLQLLSFGLVFAVAEAQGVDEKYEVLSDGSILIKDCGIEFPRPGCKDETIGFYGTTEPSGGPALLIRHNQSVCGSGFLKGPEGLELKVRSNGLVWPIARLDGFIYDAEVTSASMSAEERRRIEVMRFRFKFKPGACSGKIPQKKPTTPKPAVKPPPQKKINVPYRISPTPTPALFKYWPSEFESSDASKAD